jgi:hypothetical protein
MAYNFIKRGIRPGLPDGIFSNQKSLYGYSLEGFRTDTAGIGILWPFGIF